jgi:hypothetical protein
MNTHTAARLNNLPKNVRRTAQPVAPADPWRAGFEVGLLFGCLFVEALFLGLTWLNG